jgi:hypothetical protein
MKNEPPRGSTQQEPNLDKYKEVRDNSSGISVTPNSKIKTVKKWFDELLKVAEKCPNQAIKCYLNGIVAKNYGNKMVFELKWDKNPIWKEEDEKKYDKWNSWLTKHIAVEKKDEKTSTLGQLFLEDEGWKIYIDLYKIATQYKSPYAICALVGIVHRYSDIIYAPLTDISKSADIITNKIEVLEKRKIIKECVSALTSLSDDLKRDHKKDILLALEQISDLVDEKGKVEIHNLKEELEHIEKTQKDFPPDYYKYFPKCPELDDVLNEKQQQEYIVWKKELASLIVSFPSPPTTEIKENKDEQISIKCIQGVKDAIYVGFNAVGGERGIREKMSKEDRESLLNSRMRCQKIFSFVKDLSLVKYFSENPQEKLFFENMLSRLAKHYYESFKLDVGNVVIFALELNLEQKKLYWVLGDDDKVQNILSELRCAAFGCYDALAAITILDIHLLCQRWKCQDSKNQDGKKYLPIKVNVAEDITNCLAVLSSLAPKDAKLYSKQIRQVISAYKIFNFSWPEKYAKHIQELLTSIEKLLEKLDQPITTTIEKITTGIKIEKKDVDDIKSYFKVTLGMTVCEGASLVTDKIVKEAIQDIKEKFIVTTNEPINKPTNKPIFNVQPNTTGEKQLDGVIDGLLILRDKYYQNSKLVGAPDIFEQFFFAVGKKKYNDYLRMNDSMPPHPFYENNEWIKLVLEAAFVCHYPEAIALVRDAFIEGKLQLQQALKKLQLGLPKESRLCNICNDLSAAEQQKINGRFVDAMRHLSWNAKEKVKFDNDFGEYQEKDKDGKGFTSIKLNDQLKKEGLEVHWLEYDKEIKTHLLKDEFSSKTTNIDWLEFRDVLMDICSICLDTPAPWSIYLLKGIVPLALSKLEQKQFIFHEKDFAEVVKAVIAVQQENWGVEIETWINNLTSLYEKYVQEFPTPINFVPIDIDKNNQLQWCSDKYATAMKSKGLKYKTLVTIQPNKNILFLNRGTIDYLKELLNLAIQCRHMGATQKIFELLWPLFSSGKNHKEKTIMVYKDVKNLDLNQVKTNGEMSSGSSIHATENLSQEKDEQDIKNLLNDLLDMVKDQAKEVQATNIKPVIDLLMKVLPDPKDQKNNIIFLQQAPMLKYLCNQCDVIVEKQQAIKNEPHDGDDTIKKKREALIGKLCGIGVKIYELQNERDKCEKELSLEQVKKLQEFYDDLVKVLMECPQKEKTIKIMSLINKMRLYAEKLRYIKQIYNERCITEQKHYTNDIKNLDSKYGQYCNTNTSDANITLRSQDWPALQDNCKKNINTGIKSDFQDLPSQIAGLKEISFDELLPQLVKMGNINAFLGIMDKEWISSDESYRKHLEELRQWNNNLAEYINVYMDFDADLSLLQFYLGENSLLEKIEHKKWRNNYNELSLPVLFVAFYGLVNEIMRDAQERANKSNALVVPSLSNSFMLCMKAMVEAVSPLNLSECIAHPAYKSELQKICRVLKALLEIKKSMKELCVGETYIQQEEQEEDALQKMWDQLDQAQSKIVAQSIPKLIQEIVGKLESLQRSNNAPTEEIIGMINKLLSFNRDDLYQHKKLIQKLYRTLCDEMSKDMDKFMGIKDLIARFYELDQMKYYEVALPSNPEDIETGRRFTNQDEKKQSSNVIKNPEKIKKDSGKIRNNYLDIEEKLVYQQVIKLLDKYPFIGCGTENPNETVAGILKVWQEKYKYPKLILASVKKAVGKLHSLDNVVVLDGVDVLKDEKIEEVEEKMTESMGISFSDSFYDSMERLSSLPLSALMRDKNEVIELKKYITENLFLGRNSQEVLEVSTDLDRVREVFHRLAYRGEEYLKYIKIKEFQEKMMDCNHPLALMKWLNDNLSLLASKDKKQQEIFSKRLDMFMHCPPEVVKMYLTSLPTDKERAEYKGYLDNISKNNMVKGSGYMTTFKKNISNGVKKYGKILGIRSELSIGKICKKYANDKDIERYSNNDIVKKHSKESFSFILEQLSKYLIVANSELRSGDKDGESPMTLSVEFIEYLHVLVKLPKAYQYLWMREVPLLGNKVYEYKKIKHNLLTNFPFGYCTTWNVKLALLSNVWELFVRHVDLLDNDIFETENKTLNKKKRDDFRKLVYQCPDDNIRKIFISGFEGKLKDYLNSDLLEKILNWKSQLKALYYKFRSLLFTLQSSKSSPYNLSDNEVDKYLQPFKNIFAIEELCIKIFDDFVSAENALRKSEENNEKTKKIIKSKEKKIKGYAKTMKISNNFIEELYINKLMARELLRAWCASESPKGDHAMEKAVLQELIDAAVKYNYPPAIVKLFGILIAGEVVLHDHGDEYKKQYKDRDLEIFKKEVLDGKIIKCYGSRDVKSKSGLVGVTDELFFYADVVNSFIETYDYVKFFNDQTLKEYKSYCNVKVDLLGKPVMNMMKEIRDQWNKDRLDHKNTPISNTALIQEVENKAQELRDGFGKVEGLLPQELFEMMETMLTMCNEAITKAKTPPSDVSKKMPPVVKKGFPSSKEPQKPDANLDWLWDLCILADTAASWVHEDAVVANIWNDWFTLLLQVRDKILSENGVGGTVDRTMKYGFDKLFAEMRLNPLIAGMALGFMQHATLKNVDFSSYNNGEEMMIDNINKICIDTLSRCSEEEMKFYKTHYFAKWPKQHQDAINKISPTGNNKIKCEDKSGNTNNIKTSFCGIGGNPFFFKGGNGGGGIADVAQEEVERWLKEVKQQLDQCPKDLMKSSIKQNMEMLYKSVDQVLQAKKKNILPKSISTSIPTPPM